MKKTQWQIAEAVCISECYFNLIENGKRGVKIELAAAIAKELKVTLDEFFALYNYSKCKEKNRLN